MKVLMAYRASQIDNNLFVDTLVDGIRLQGLAVDCSLDKFWDDSEVLLYDIVHIQWPEELFEWKDLDDRLVDRLHRKLDSIKEKGVKIVYTRHNVEPHYSDVYLKQLYALVEQYSDAIVHLGEFSLKEFRQNHPNVDNIQCVIPHHIYEGVYDENIPQDEARKKLNIPQDKFVILSFGKFRNKAEILMVLKVFFAFRLKNKFLVAPRILPFEKHPKNYNVINRLISFCGYHVFYPLSRLFNMKLGLESEMVRNTDLSLYFSASDVVFVQRKNILNSGNIPTAFLFKKVVIGPASGNMKEILTETGNPVFDPFDNSSIVKALNVSVGLKNSNWGVNNYEYACKHWNVEKVSKDYITLYNNLKSKCR